MGGPPVDAVGLAWVEEALLQPADGDSSQPTVGQ